MYQQKMLKIYIWHIRTTKFSNDVILPEKLWQAPIGPASVEGNANVS